MNLLVRTLFIVLILQWKLLFMMHSCSAIATGNQTDYEALLSIKFKITHDPYGAMRLWNDSVHFCQWKGITCGHRHMRVTVINLRSNALTGSLSPYIGNLTFLRFFLISNNSFYGQIPPEIGRLFRLQLLRLQNNSFTGQIPSKLSHCSNLQGLGIAYNKIHGKIPSTIGDLFNLQFISFHYNSLSGQIPDSIGNLSSLNLISAAGNSLEGSIPNSFGQLKSLTFLGLGGNNLFGVVPPSIYNLSAIATFSFPFNYRIQGYLPSNLGDSFPNLQEIDVRYNQLFGEIPLSLPNASQLGIILMSDNYFTGQVPRNFGILQNLSTLELSNNSLGTGGPNDMDFFTSLVNCSKLQNIGLQWNRFGGSLPMEIANLSSQMVLLAIGVNNLSGTINSGIGNLINLYLLDFSFNQLTGIIPTSIGCLQQLRQLNLDSNRLTGEIPYALGNITWLSQLHLHDNRLQGTIPDSIQNCTNLLLLDLSFNNLNGGLTKEAFNLPSLPILLNLSHNQITGPLPSSVENMKTLGKLDISWNKLSGRIPASLGSCTSLELLFMHHNSFEGSIPSSFSSLLGIQFLDLSMNNLTGLIPSYLQTIQLLYLNLSFNNFEGEVPVKGIFKNISAVSVVGNYRLCGGMPELLLPKCARKKTNNHNISSLYLSSFIIGFCILIGITVQFCWFKKKKKDRISVNSLEEAFPHVSYEQIMRATDGFSSSNLIGVGSFSSVYKGSIDEDGSFAAIKVFNLKRRGASKSFLAECDVLRNIRHRNLVKIITSCSSIDLQGNDFKALLYEYMPKGSLEKWLAPAHDQNLNLRIRLNIAIDVACALEYLHQQCQDPIIHCDLKPSNVLLDNDMTGHIGDFGLARILVEEIRIPDDQSSSAGVKGTIGYVAPEYGLGGEISREGDVYSFGILLLEMMTSRRPTDSMFENELNLHNYAAKAIYDENVMEILDPSIVREYENEVTTNQRSSLENIAERIEECISNVLRIGVACSMDSPADRMEMSLVVQKLVKVRDMLEKSN